MHNDPRMVAQQALRGTDSNSLLRLYDQWSVIFRQSQSQQERVKAQKIIQRIASELENRQVRP